MVQQIRRILYTTDLSKSSIEVFEHTVALAAQTGASIIMLHVIEDGSSSAQNRMVYLIDREVYEKIRSESSDIVKNVLIGKQRTIPVIQNALKQLCDDTTDKVCAGDQPLTIDAIEVRYGNVADAVLALADEAACDLIAIGYHKKGSLLRALMGSAGTSVIKQSRKPVYLVPLQG